MVARRRGGPPDPTQQVPAGAGFVDRYGADPADTRLVTSTLTKVLLDIEVVAALPRTSWSISRPDTDAGFLGAVSSGAHAAPTPSAISNSSGGQSEDQQTAQAGGAVDQARADTVLRRPRLGPLQRSRVPEGSAVITFLTTGPGTS